MLDWLLNTRCNPDEIEAPAVFKVLVSNHGIEVVL
jgi:hypothetical protein